jgi:glycosyltransferase involved in cell wall biosynthesis
MRLFVLPSFMENCPNALLEAMAAGVPIVASKVGGIPELVDDTCAQLVAPGDPRALAEAISTLLADGERARIQATKARRRVEAHFTADRNASRVLELYEDLVSARRSDR